MLSCILSSPLSYYVESMTLVHGWRWFSTFFCWVQELFWKLFHSGSILIRNNKTQSQNIEAHKSENEIENTEKMRMKGSEINWFRRDVRILRSNFVPVKRTVESAWDGLFLLKLKHRHSLIISPNTFQVVLNALRIRILICDTGGAIFEKPGTF